MQKLTNLFFVILIISTKDSDKMQNSRFCTNSKLLNIVSTQCNILRFWCQYSINTMSIQCQHDVNTTSTVDTVLIIYVAIIL